MDRIGKGPDRINVTKKTRDFISRIDETSYFGLQDSQASRSELFLFAMAIGADTLPLPLENQYPGGLVLEKSIDIKTKSLMYALFINQLKEGELDKITQKDAVYVMAQEYANTGFEYLEDYMGKHKDTELIWELLAEMDKQHEKVLTSSQ